MSKRRWALAIALSLTFGLAAWSRLPARRGVATSSATGGPSVQPRTTYGLGRQPSDDEVARRNLTISPSGAGLPKGQGDAAEGERIYIKHCAACHGERGEGRGAFGPAVAGGVGSLRSEKPQLTVGSYWPYATTVFDYTRRAMPYQTPGSLTTDETYAVTAYMLYLSGILSKQQILDERALPVVKMPNRDGFVPDPRPDTRENAGHRPAQSKQRGVAREP